MLSFFVPQMTLLKLLSSWLLGRIAQNVGFQCRGHLTMWASKCSPLGSVGTIRKPLYTSARKRGTLGVSFMNGGCFEGSN